jgi:20S proteasome alpha/beta subunit
MICGVFVTMLIMGFARRTAVALTDSNYIAVTALDKYGNSVQLQHAHEAATRHGIPVVAAKCKGGVVVVSFRRLRPEISTPHALIQTSSLHPPHVGIVCAGLKADAKWLISMLRDQRKHIWETYDINNLSRKRSQELIAQALLTFMGYNRDKELHDGLAVDPDDTWARPLGVQTMIFSHDGPITTIEPSGAIRHYHAQAIGNKCEECNEKLEEQYDGMRPAQEVQDMLINIMRELHVSSSEDSELFVEILTPDGVVRSLPEHRDQL